jgi:hypothetical protein
METCPICNARIAGKAACHRCKSDLSVLIVIEQKAAARMAAAWAAFKTNDYKMANTLSRQSLALKTSSKARTLCRHTGFGVEK